MNALEWLRETGATPVRPVYTVYGDDSYLVRESVRRVMRTVLPGEDQESGISRFTGSATSLATVLDELFTLPFFSRRRLVVVEEADTFVTKHRKDLEAYVARPSTTGILLLQVKQWISTTNLAKLVDANGLAINASAPRESDLVKWLVPLAKSRFNAQISADTARLLVEMVGPEAGILASEIEKLAVYAGDSARIERADIVALVGAGRVEKIWKAIDAATTGQTRVALELLNTLLAAGEQPVGILSAMTFSLLKIYHAGRLRIAGVSLEEACRLAGIWDSAVHQTRKQHAHLGPRRVDQLPSILARADLDLKGDSSLDPRTILEMLVVRLGQPRDD